MISAIAALLGISNVRLIVYAALVVASLGAAATIRQHYINLGWDKAITSVKKQDSKAKAAAEEVERKAGACSADSYWDVITATCKGDAE